MKTSRWMFLIVNRIHFKLQKRYTTPSRVRGQLSTTATACVIMSIVVRRRRRRPKNATKPSIRVMPHRRRNGDDTGLALPVQAGVQWRQSHNFVQVWLYPKTPHKKKMNEPQRQWPALLSLLLVTPLHASFPTHQSSDMLVGGAVSAIHPPELQHGPCTPGGPITPPSGHQKAAFSFKVFTKSVRGDGNGGQSKSRWRATSALDGKGWWCIVGHFASSHAYIG